MRENHPRRRQIRRVSRQLERRKASRSSLPAILVVCEGKETEPNYVLGLCDEHGVNRANVTVLPGGEDTNPAALVRKALRRFALDRDFDSVFVVCDCAGEDLTDAHRLASQPLESTEGKAVPLSLIVSRPSFEFWLLLHFEYLSRPLSAAQALDLLRRHVTDYDKGDRQIFRKVQNGLDRALLHTARLKSELERVGEQSPDTDMPRLVEAMMALRRRAA